MNPFPGFYNYYDATVDAVKAYDVAMKIGGPGGSCHDYDVTTYCWGLLNHVVHGTNIVTKEKGAPIDYISIHKKVYFLLFPMSQNNRLKVRLE